MTRVRQAAQRYLAALDALMDSNDRGEDDTGKRHTDSYRRWMELDCEHSLALEELREAAGQEGAN
jgi:hypothetical protein